MRLTHLILAAALLIPVAADAHPCRAKKRVHRKPAPAVVAEKPCAPCPEVVATPVDVRVVHEVAPVSSPCTTYITQITRLAPERHSGRHNFSVGIAALASISDNLNRPEPIANGYENYGHYKKRHSAKIDDPDTYLIARGFVDYYLDKRARLFANYDMDTRGKFDDGTFRVGASVDMLGNRASVTKLSLYGGGQRSVVSDQEWNGFAGGAAEHELVGPLGLLGQAEYDFGREVLTARGGASLRLY